MIAPLVMGAFMYLMTRNVMSIVFVALSPLIMIGTWVDQRIRRRRMLKHSTQVFMTALAKARSDIKAAHAREHVAQDEGELGHHVPGRGGVDGVLRGGVEAEIGGDGVGVHAKRVAAVDRKSVV